MRQIKLQAIVMIAFAMLTANAQTIKEKEYTLVYSKSDIEMQFEQQASAIIVNAVDVHSQKPVAFYKKEGNYVLENLTPAEIIKVEYQLPNQKANAIQTVYIATESLSTGTIEVYFNHPVDTSFSQIQNAVNLANTLDDKLITYINACQSTLDIAIYNSSSLAADLGIAGAINAAYNRGVQVRVIYDGSTGGNMISLLNSNIPKLASPTSSSYGIMHNKFVIFDANNSDPNKPYVWTGSTNWTQSQIDGPDKNSVILIQDQSLALGYKIEFEEMWGSNTMTPDTVLSEFGPYKTDNTPHHYIIGGKTVDSYFSPSDNTTASIIDTINSANTDLDIATMLITRTDIATAIVNKYNSGIDNVHVVVDSQNPASNQISYLQANLPTNNAEVFTNSGILHHKFMVVDNFNSTSDPLVLLGSHNWSNSAENKNDENTLIVHDLNIANQYYQAFAYLYEDAGGVLARPNFEANAFVLYPNPTSDYVTIHTTQSSAVNEATVCLYDVLGKKVYQQYYSQLQNESLSLSHLPAGLYLVTIQSHDKTWHDKIVKP